MAETDAAFPADPEELLAHSGWIRALARSLVLDPDRAEDVVQDAWLAYLRERPARLANPAGWLAQVARNAARQAGRAGGRRARRERAAARPEAQPSAEELVERADLHGLVVRAVVDLEEPYRSTVLLRYFEEQTAEQIARQQGVPASTVRTRLARGLARLRERLDERHGGDRRAWALALLPLARRGRPVAEGLRRWPLPAAAASGVAVVALVVATRDAPRHDEPARAALVASDVASETREPVDVVSTGESSARRAVAPDPVATATRDPRSVLRGVVRDFETGEPIAGAEVFRGDRWKGRADTWTDDLGRFELELDGVEAGVQVTTGAAGYSGVRRELDDELLAGGGVLEFPLVRGGVIDVTVTDPAGRPIEGADVSVREAPYPEDYPATIEGLLGALSALPDGAWLFAGRDAGPTRVATDRRGRTDADGRCRVRRLVSNVGAHFVHVQAGHPDWAPAASEAVRVDMPSDHDAVELVLERGGTLTGIVTREGAGVPGHVLWRGPGGTSGHARIGPGGAYRIERVPTGRILLRAMPSSQVGDPQEAELHVEPEGLLVHDFDLSVPTGVLSGSIVASDGTPMKEVHVSARGSSGDLHGSTRSADDGRWTLVMPADREYLVEVRDPPCRVERDGLVPGGPPFDVRWPELGELEVHAIDAESGEGVPDADVFWRPASGGPFLLVPPPESGAPLRLPLGVVDLRVCAHERGLRPTTLRNVAVPGPPLSVPLPRGADLTLRFVGEGRDRPDFHLFFLLADDEHELVRGRRNEYLGFDFSVGGDDAQGHDVRARSVTLDHWGSPLGRDGRVRLRGLEPGRYRVRALPDDLILDPPDVVVPEVPRAEAVVRWRQSP